MNAVQTRWVDDRTLEMKMTRPDGLIARCEMSWKSPAEAEANCEKAITDFAERNDADTARRRAGERYKTWHIPRTRLYFTILSGPPTWLLPHVYVRRRSVCVGWLRLGFLIGTPSEKAPS